ncbi:MAG: hypothetical protein K5633_06240 [Paludibacteraceae bacterium]|nr:hypothetical protein [Paludibacteraceae bacterium]
MAGTANKAEITVEEKLLALKKLQDVVSEIDKIKTIRGELPLEVQDLEDDLVGLSTRLEKYKKDIADTEEEIKKHKHNITDASAKIEKYKTQQENVSNNKEFDALSKEIEFQKLDIEVSEKKIKEYSALVEQKKSELEKNQEDEKEKTEILAQKKNELEDIIAETRQDEERLVEKQLNIEKTIDARLLSAFKRIRSNAHNGLAVVSIDRDACGGCFNKIPAQRQLDIKSRKKIIVCEYCGRILIDPELGENPTPEVASDNEVKQTKKKATSKKDA